MKNIIQTLLLLMAFLLSCQQTSSQQLLLPQPPNTNPSELSYSYMVIPHTKQSSTQKVATQIADKIKEGNLTGLKEVQSLDSLPDVVFVLGGIKSEQTSQIATTATKLGASVVPLNTESPANEAMAFLKKRYFSGVRPTYSTVFTKGEPYNNYRIPGVVATKNGTIVAFAEARSSAHDQAENDIVVRRSVDGGKTWSELIVVASNGQSSLNNPAPTYVPQNNTIILLYQDYPPKTSESSVTIGSVRCFVTISSDEGATWSTPRDISESVRQPDAASYCTGPASGIVIQEGQYKGRIVVSCNVNMPTWYNYLIYSDDQGQTWHIAKGRSAYGTNESQVAEIGTGELLISARVHRNAGDTSFDAPKDWNPWNFSIVTRCRALIPVTINDSTQWDKTQIREELVDPTCQGSIMRYNINNEKFVLLMSNAASQYTHMENRPYANTPPMRINGSIRYSTDRGKTWSVAKRIYGNRFTEYQYSVLVQLENGKVGCIFEANDNIKFAVFDLAWIIN